MTSRVQKRIFVAILLVTAVLIFFRLTRQDMLSDDGHYAFRALGYYDYLVSQRQTTPVQWFSERPLWSYFSFHDHPPLFFLLEGLFLKMFGATVFVSRLLPALAAMGSLILVYLLGRRLGGVKVGLFSAGALALNNFFIWNGRIGHIESLFLFLFLLSFFYLVKALTENSSNFLWFGFYLGLSLLTKYTIFFALPALIIYLVWRERGVFRIRSFWLGVLIFIVVSSPVLIYNLGMYQARGHFDVQFSDLFGQEHNDWPLLNKRISGFNFNFPDVLKTLGNGFSWPVLGLSGVAILGSLYFAWAKKKPLWYLPALVFLSMAVLFSYVGAAARWLPVTAPFAALAIGLNLEGMWQNISSRRLAVITATVVLSGIGLYSLFYTLNTNHFRAPVGGRGWYADFRLENLGYNQLDKKISQLLRGKDAPLNFQRVVAALWYPEIKPEALPTFKDPRADRLFPEVIIYDSDTNWFPTVWTFDRWKLYEGMLLVSSYDLFRISSIPENLEFLNQLGIEGYYYIHAGRAVKQDARTAFWESQKLLESFRQKDSQPEIIYDDKGREAFYIYHSATLDL